MSQTPTTPQLADVPLERIGELVHKLDVRGPRYTSYPTVPVWRSDLPPHSLARSLTAVAQRGAPIAVYLHLPFCRSRCLYCGCNSFVCNDVQRMKDYAAAVGAEIALLSPQLGSAIRHQQLHVGGGTPTHLPAELLADLLDQLLAAIPGDDRAQRSIEVDPRVTTLEHLDRLAERGFSRLSIGVQDLDPAVQAAVRRRYELTELQQFVAAARERGFSSVNLDLIYGLPQQTPQSWAHTLQAILQVDPDRLACFGYAHLPSRLAHQRAIDESALPSPEARLEMLVNANRFFTGEGYYAIGMDHFARPTDELAIARQRGRLWRNFMGYTDTRGLELVGIGCSGISELHELFVQNETSPERYAEAVNAGRSPVVRGHVLDADDRYRKQLINHLMCNLELAPPEDFEGEDGARRWEQLGDALASLHRYEADGLIVKTENGYRVTALGQLFVRNFAMAFDRYLGEQQGVKFSRTV